MLKPYISLFSRSLLITQSADLEEVAADHQLTDQLTDRLAGICELLESLLAADSSLAVRLDWLVGQLSQYDPCPELNAWFRRMFGLSASSDRSFFAEVGSVLGDPCPELSAWFMRMFGLSACSDKSFYFYFAEVCTVLFDSCPELRTGTWFRRMFGLSAS